MFDLFKKKKSGDVIDFTALQKRGLLKEDANQDASYESISPHDTSDLSAPIPSASEQNDYAAPVPSPSADSQVDTGFFSAMASSAEPSPSYNAFAPESTTGANNAQSSYDSYANKDKIDKIEGRVEHILDRIYKILQRIEILERKIERLERRSGLGRLETY